MSITSFLVFVLPHWQPLVSLLLLALVALIERRVPRRAPAIAGRWVCNIGLTVLTAILIELGWEPIRVAVIGLGAALQLPPIALLPLPSWVLIPVSVLILDLMQFTIHLGAHTMPPLWRLHQVHHSDAAFDASTGLRHHPAEVFVTGALVLFAYAALGLPLIVIAGYGAVAAMHNLFTHANLRVPERVDRWLRWVIVTPDMHRVHHSARLDEGNSNFGMVFPWWDRLARTYIATLRDGHATAALGLPDGTAASASFLGVLASPTLPARNGREGQS